jgi:hypothetical protein
VVTLRSATRVRFSTNFFHNTWHILSDRTGALLLGRLFWGLAFQRPGTIVFLDGEHLVPTPFEGDPAAPIALVPGGVTGIDEKRMRALRRGVHGLERSPFARRTIRWDTRGLAAAIDEDDWRARPHHDLERDRLRERMIRLAGVVCYVAPPSILRVQATAVYRMRDARAMSYQFLAWGGARRGCHADGEVQVFSDFRGMCSAARVARREVVGASSTHLTEAEREHVYRRAEAAQERLREGRRRRAAVSVPP